MAILSLDFGTGGITALYRESDQVVKADIPFNDHFGVENDGVRTHEYPGQAFQPVQFYTEGFEAVMGELRSAVGDAGMHLIRAVGIDGQQHGSTYWRTLDEDRLAGNCALEDLASEHARIWQTASSSAERRRMLKNMGGVNVYVDTAGSQPFERYTGTVIADTKRRHPDVYEQAQHIRLIEQIPWMLLTGNADAPLGWGGACGTALWNYRRKDWDPELLFKATAEMNGELRQRLPRIVPPGTGHQVHMDVAERFGLRPDCIIYEPAGDNPATRVTVPDDRQDGEYVPATVISLGTSITVNIGLGEETVDPNGALALMFDYVGRPFFLACKTNGVTAANEILRSYEMGFEEHDKHIAHHLRNLPAILAPGAARILLHYPQTETFPEGLRGSVRTYDRDRGHDAVAVYEGCFADIAVHAGQYLPDSVHVVGGATKSEPLMQMLAGILDRRLLLGAESSEGAAMGANYAAEYFFRRDRGEGIELADVVGTAGAVTPVDPDPKVVAHYHRPGGYLDQFKDVQSRMRA